MTLVGQPVEVVSDRRRLDRILANLVANAVHHGGPPVAVTVYVEDGWAVVEVADRGPGIHPDDLPRIFDRFYKVDQARTVRPRSGSGLGLAIVREQAMLVGAEVTASSTVGAGSCFTVRLPMEAETTEPSEVSERPELPLLV